MTKKVLILGWSEITPGSPVGRIDTDKARPLARVGIRVSRQQGWHLGQPSVRLTLASSISRVDTRVSLQQADTRVSHQQG